MSKRSLPKKGLKLCRTSKMIWQATVVVAAGIACIYMCLEDMELPALGLATGVGAWGVWCLGFYPDDS